MNNDIERWYRRRLKRLTKRGANFDADDEDDGKKGGGSHGNTRLPYGIAKGQGIDTNGMTPKEVWSALAGEGVSAKQEYAKLKSRNSKGSSERWAKTPSPTSKGKEAGSDKEMIAGKEKYESKRGGLIDGSGMSEETKSLLWGEGHKNSAYSSFERKLKNAAGNYERLLKVQSDIYDKLDRGLGYEDYKKLSDQAKSLIESAKKEKEKGSRKPTKSAKPSVENPEKKMLKVPEIDSRSKEAKKYFKDNDALIEKDINKFLRKGYFGGYEFDKSGLVYDKKKHTFSVPVKGLGIRAHYSIGISGQESADKKTFIADKHHISSIGYSKEKKLKDGTGSGENQNNENSSVWKDKTELMRFKGKDSTKKGSEPTDSESFGEETRRLREQFSRRGLPHDGESKEESRKRIDVENRIKGALQKLGDLEQRDEVGPVEWGEARNGLASILNELPDGASVVTESGGRNSTSINVYKKEGKRLSHKIYSGSVDGKEKFYENDRGDRYGADALIDGMRDVLDDRFVVRMK